MYSTSALEVTRTAVGTWAALVGVKIPVSAL
jgi:hypothetical protein